MDQKNLDLEVEDTNKKKMSSDEELEDEVDEDGNQETWTEEGGHRQWKNHK